MTNIALPSIEHYLDVASKNAYHTFHRWQSPEKRLRRIHRSSRDSARTPMQWSGGANAGFSSVTPWFHLNPNYTQINVAAEESDQDSILHFYRRCLALRKRSETLLWGSYREYYPHHRKLYLYERAYRGERILVICSFSKRGVKYRLPKGYDGSAAELLLDNYPSGETAGVLRPYEVKVYRWQP